MGCWYASCSISQLPILENEEIVLLFSERKDPNLIITLPVITHYNEYGGITDTPQNELNNITLQLLKYLTKLDGDTFESIVNSPGFPRQQFIYFFVKKTIWDDFLNIVEEGEYPHLRKETYRTHFTENAYYKLNNMIEDYHDSELRSLGITDNTLHYEKLNLHKYYDRYTYDLWFNNRANLQPVMSLLERVWKEVRNLEKVSLMLHYTRRNFIEDAYEGHQQLKYSYHKKVLDIFSKYVPEPETYEYNGNLIEN